MNLPLAPTAGSLDLAGLPAPGRLTRAARLYAVVLDGEGRPGGRRFLAELPEGAAVFALSAPGVGYLLNEHAAPADLPLISAAAIDAIAIDAWYGALLSAPGLVHSNAQAVPMAPGERRTCTAGASVTARQIVWLEAATPILRYAEAAGIEAAPLSRLVMADQTGVEVTGDGEVQAIGTTALLERELPAVLGEPSAELARRIGAALIRRDVHQRQRWQQTRQIDETRAALGLQRLRDIASAACRPLRPCAPARITCPPSWRSSPRRRASPSARRLATMSGRACSSA